MTSRMALAGATLACGIALVAPAAAQGGSLGLRMLESVNGVRAQHGLEALGGSRSLHRSARRYASWMLRADYFGHLGRIRASSRFSLLGENLAWHSGRRPRVSRTVRRWMKSPPHRALILHPGFRWLGAGVARGSLGGRRATVWVLHLGGLLRPAGAAAPALPVLGDQPASESTILSASPEIASTTSPAGASRPSAAP
jgi:uncharacterized protein YkwD